MVDWPPAAGADVADQETAGLPRLRAALSGLDRQPDAVIALDAAAGLALTVVREREIDTVVLVDPRPFVPG